MSGRDVRSGIASPRLLAGKIIARQPCHVTCAITGTIKTKPMKTIAHLACGTSPNPAAAGTAAGLGRAQQLRSKKSGLGERNHQFVTPQKPKRPRRVIARQGWRASCSQPLFDDKSIKLNELFRNIRRWRNIMSYAAPWREFEANVHCDRRHP